MEEFVSITLNGYSLDVYKNGDVYKHKRVIMRSNGKIMSLKGGLMKRTYDPHGYYKYDFKFNGKTKSKIVHRLIAELFIPNPLNLPCINHINGIKTDNRIENLEWCTHQHNNIHARDTGLNKADSERHYAAKLTDEQVLNIVKDVRKNAEIALDYGVCREAIKDIKLGKNWHRLTGIKYSPKRKTINK